MQTLLNSIGVSKKAMPAQSARAFSKLVQTVRPTIFWEVGDTIGAYAWLALEHSKTCKVILFESNPHNYLALLKTIHKKQWHRANAKHIVVAAACGGTSVYRDSTTAIVGAMPKYVADQETALSVAGRCGAGSAIETVTLDGVLAKGYASPDIIKINTPDAERLIIDGTRQVLETCSPILIVKAASPKLVRYLEGMNYRSFPFDQDNLIFVSVYF